jgi:hypothetical protein
VYARIVLATLGLLGTLAGAQPANAKTPRLPIRSLAAVCAPPVVASSAAFSSMWAQSPGGFVAGDMGFSVAHPSDGSSAFIFGDSALNTTGGRVFAHSTMVRWSSSGLTRVIGDNPDQSFLPDPDGAGPQVYWPLGAVVDAGRLYVFSDRVTYGSGGGLFDFATHGRDVAVYDWPSCASPVLRLVATTPSSGRPTSGDAPKVMWGSGAYSSGGFVYVYGTYGESGWFTANRTYLARVPSGRLDNVTAWRYWNGSSYVADEKSAAIVNDEHGFGVEATLSVHKIGTTWRMTSKGDGIWGNNAVLYSSANPYGPWTRTDLFACPWGADPDHSYGAFGHDELAKTADGKFLASVGHNHDGGRLEDMWDYPERYRVTWNGIS